MLRQDRTVDLVPLSTEEYGDFIECQIVEYAQGKSRAGQWRPEEALDRSREVLHDFIVGEAGARERGHRFFKGLDETKEHVGWLWEGPIPAVVKPKPEHARWLYQITVRESLRRKGYGRAMLQVLEELLVRAGVADLYLNVFRWNQAARALYDSMGYEVVYDGETETGMRKRLVRQLEVAQLIRLFTPKDYPAMLEVFNAAIPEYPLSVEEIRFEDEHADPKCRKQRWVAERGGRVVGVGEYYQRASRYHPHKFWIDGYVHPDHQGQGIGSALYDHVTAALQSLDPLALLCVVEEDKTHSLSFIKERGWQEESRTWISRLDLNTFDSTSYAGLEAKMRAQRIEIKTFNELECDPDRNRKLYDLRWAIQQDVPASGGMAPTPIDYEFFVQNYLSGPTFMPEGYFVAIQGNEYVGLSNFWGTDGRQTIRTGLTGVRRSYRRKGIALALKLRGIAYAKKQGYAMIETNNASSNRPMLAINERLGFVKQPAVIVFMKVLKAEE
jgi:GNAT superfamily N-acetyltransferase